MTTVDSMNEGLVQGLIDTREVLLGLAVAMRYLWYWTFVAQRPVAEPSLDAPDGNHSGAWKRWGTVGLVLKWVLFAAVLDVFVLQILWRVVPNLENAGPVYLADASIQTIASALLIAKLVANTWITPILPRGRVLRDYALPIVAILFGMGVAIGNLTTCEY